MKDSNRCSAQRGFSLVELMIAMLLGLILIIGVMQIFITSKQTYSVQQSAATMQEDARFVLSRISSELRQMGMFGCLDIERLPAATRNQIPTAFATPVSFQDDILTIITADSAVERVTEDVTLTASGLGAGWLLVSDCVAGLGIDNGAGVTAAAGDLVIPVRQLEYRLTDHALKTRVNGMGNFETLIEGVSGFEVQFGLAATDADVHVSGAYVTDITGAEKRVRSVRLALQLAEDPSDPDAGSVKTKDFTLVAALRNRLD
ncbi:prepilin-type N-terminal cleavage/methylation domain-containing protein [Pseudomonas sp. gcc21]|uniref:prepilin-type N-terminal cleavage/methylation domain-containing protein n=1 Tax=Pseudomonas sp. gcc21 TaxID=2726989 RepID=UPI0014529326|nr:prepilin-type N-terminal cleavage/methylation domain-containing protein [Pseudomonas sp. gcc21]QJD60325.1 prepilin-type N-terminal cleavage/methylation domain-containing protein [Pseudomonas sp. gcc21]